jgi:hypothetical protein
MNRRSAAIIAASLVFALTAGTVSRMVTLHQSTAAAPVSIVVQTPAPQSPPAVTTANYERE